MQTGNLACMCAGDVQTKWRMCSSYHLVSIYMKFQWYLRTQVYLCYVVWLLNGQRFIGNCICDVNPVKMCKNFDLLSSRDFSVEGSGSKFCI